MRASETIQPAAAQPQPPPLLGGKYVKMIDKHLRRLHKAYAHGNRVLFYDDLVTAYLLAFFNPTLNSLRTISDMSISAKGQQHLGLTKLCRSTMSDANAMMDPRLLEPLIAHLRSQIPDLQTRDGQLARLLQQVQIVDGSFFAAAADVAFAIQRTSGGGPLRSKVRLDLHLDGNLLPRHIAVCGKECGESKSAARQIDPQAIYILDRGYVDFTYLGLLLGKSADFVLRVQQTINFDLRHKQILDEEDRAAGVISDSVGLLSGSPHTKAILPGQEVREILIHDQKNPDKPIRLITSLMDLPAHVIAQLYRWRWQIELFFRWLKVHAHFRHLISHSKNGMTLGFYVAVIAVLLIYLHTNRPINKYAYSLLALAASGGAEMEDILPILEAREKECQRDRRSLALRRGKKTGK
ncbi:MAG TPA: IS4 family transposase [Tepidisphaeraceae bacterium]